MKKLLNGYTLFASVFLFHLIWIFQGLDIEDTGYHLSKQVAAFCAQVVPGSVSMMTFLTDFIGGMWLKIVDVPSVLWARVGGVLCYALNAAIAYRILCMYFDRKRTFFVVLTSSLFITGLDIVLIHYYSLPALLLNVWLLIYNALLNTSAEKRSFKIYSFLLGFVAIAIVLARLPLIFIGLAPAILLGYCLITKESARKGLYAIPYVLVGVVVSAIAFGVLYQGVGILDGYFGTLASVFGYSGAQDGGGVGGVYKLWRMIQWCAPGYAQVLGLTGVACLGLFIASVVKDRFGKGAGIAFMAIPTVGGFVGAYLVLGHSIGLASRMIMLLVGVTVLVTFVFLRHDRVRDIRLALLLLVSVYVMLISHIGSNVGVWKSVYGMWLALPLVLLVTYELKRNVASGRLKSMVSLNVVVITLLLIVSLCRHCTNVYVDCQNRLKLTTRFRYKYLRCLYSTKGRVNVVDEALMHIARFTDKDDETLMIFKIPMFYYLSQTRPVFDCPWVRGTSPEKLEVMYEKAARDKRYPKVFVCTKIDTGDFSWPCASRKLSPGSQRKIDYLKEKYINELGYSKVLENAAFAVYVPPEDIEARLGGAGGG